MKKFTFENCRREHNKMWLLLAETGIVHKDSYPELNRIRNEYGRAPSNICFACEYTKGKEKRIHCEKCPIAWDGEKCEEFNCENNKGEYKLWMYAHENERKRLALIIANKKWTDKRKEKP